MQHNDEITQSLMKLGLTLLQAKTYSTLAKRGSAEVKTIAKASNIARQDVYRVMPTLEKTGLAEKIIANPIRYQANPLRTGLSKLLQQKTEEQNTLQKRIEALINNFEESRDKISLQEKESQFRITL